MIGDSKGGVGEWQETIEKRRKTILLYPHLVLHTIWTILSNFSRIVVARRQPEYEESGESVEVGQGWEKCVEFPKLKHATSISR